MEQEQNKLKSQNVNEQEEVGSRSGSENLRSCVQQDKDDGVSICLFFNIWLQKSRQKSHSHYKIL